MHFIEEDLCWIASGIPELVLVYEIEEYLAKWAEFERLFGDAFKARDSGDGRTVDEKEES